MRPQFSLSGALMKTYSMWYPARPFTITSLVGSYPPQPARASSNAMDAVTRMCFIVLPKKRKGAIAPFLQIAGGGLVYVFQGDFPVVSVCTDGNAPPCVGVAVFVFKHDVVDTACWDVEGEVVICDKEL